MSSRFVSGGTIAGDASSPTTNTDSTPAPAPSTATTSQSSAAWEKAQAQLESDRRAREAARKAAVESSSGQSLYEVLQANKAAKQAAFEESNKIRNQFRALDDDEVDFLEEVEARERREAEEQKHAEEVGLREFRDAQKKLEGATASVDAAEEGQELVPEVDAATLDEWSTGAARKRKREKEPVIKGIKRRASENAKDGSEKNIAMKDERPPASSPSSKAGTTNSGITKDQSPETARLAATAKSKMGLVDYGSDEDDDD